MEETVDQVQEQVSQAKAAYDRGRRAINDLSKTATEKSKQALTYTDDWVHENTWLALGLVAGAGLVLGVFVAWSLQRD
jgi:ElaB/YqjD/DUF883 family membrane-anchored ribosome-binding protein